MTFKFRLWLLILCAVLSGGFTLRAADATAEVAPPDTNSFTRTVANSLLQLQEQLHDAQLTLQNIESNRVALAETEQQSAAAITARIQSLEQSIATERNRQIAAAQASRHWVLAVVSGFGAVILLLVLALGYLQWRATRRMMLELSAAARPVELSAASGNATVEQSNARLFNMVDVLEKRILSMEQTGARPLAPANGSATNAHAAEPANEGADHIANLLADGQALLDANKPEHAIARFNDVLSVEPNHTDALVKKGAALERLERLDEAIECYDRAIAQDESLTVAYLQKGGLFNRLARYDEALQCYERALRTQEKGLPRNEAA